VNALRNRFPATRQSLTGRDQFLAGDAAPERPACDMAPGEPWHGIRSL